MELNDEQRAAVEYIDGPLLVIAGPGTGKTQILSKRVAQILQVTDTAPENILCLTFTDSGAENMRKRIKKLVGPEGAKVIVTTYHGFGGDILAQYKDYSPSYNKRMDAVLTGVAQYKIIKEIMDELPGTDLLRGDSVKEVLGIISEVKGARLTAENLRLIAEENIKDAKLLTEVIAPYFDNIVKGKFDGSYENAYLPAWEELKQCIDLPLIMPKVERSIVKVARDLGEVIEKAAETKKVTPLTKWKEKYFELDGEGKYRTRDRVKNLKLKSIATVLEKYNAYLVENGLYDFNDMIEDANRALETDEGFRMTLAEKYQYIMLDEFQDTNPAQLSIVKHITDYEKPNVMAVGDDDQGIYAFQGALASNMRDFSEHYGAHEITLVKNYRSTAGILDYATAVIEQADDRYMEKHFSAERGKAKEFEVERHEFETSDAECAYIARRIHELVTSGVEQSEIAVLSYKTKYFMPLLPFLREYPEIKIAYEKQDNILENPQIYELLQVARFVCDTAAEKRSEVSLTEILGYQFWDLPLIEIMGVISRARMERRNIFEALAASENEEVQKVTKFLAELVVKSREEPFEVFMEYLIGARELDGYRSPFLSYYTEHAETSGEYAAFQLYDNLACLREAVQSYFAGKVAKIGDFLSMVDDYEMAGETISTTSPYREADSAVQIMTAHKAKGMEFEYVFIITADTNAWGKGGGNHDRTSLPSNVTFIHHTGMTDGERIRILYVALTRARDHLIITNAKRDYSGSARRRLEYLKEEEVDGEVVTELIPGMKVTLEVTPEDYAVLASNARDWFSRYTAPRPELRTYFLEQVERMKMSASILTSFVDVVYGGPREFMRSTLMPSMPTPDTESQAYGHLIHKTFEYVTNTLASDEAAVDYFLTELDTKSLPNAVLSKLRDKGPAALSAALSKFRPIVERGKAEVDFGPEKLVVDGVRVTGKIDHIVIDEDTKTIEVYDFKTAGYSDKKWDAATGTYKYAMQLMFYKLLLNASPRFRKYKVERGHILYVEPDKDGVVYDKVYEYDDASETEFRKLLAAVWHQIEGLKFMDDPEVFIEPDGGKGVKEMKEFIQLLLDKNT